MSTTATLAEQAQLLPPTAYPPRKKTEVLKDWLFQRIHGNKLVYNTCWEDPRCDRAMLELTSDSEVVMITSAGDNALAYLLDCPRRIHCVDVNPRQNALLDLKLAGLQSLSWSAFFDLFGEGRRRDVATTYGRHLRPRLQKSSREYWDANLHYFKPGGARAGLYFHGSSGVFAWGMRQLLRLDRRLFHEIEALFATRNIDEQRTRYFALEPRLLKRLVGGELRQRVSLSLVGVPASQRRFIEAEAGGLKHYVREAFRRIFVELPVHDNYFYSLYFHGRYALDCCPAYLEAANFRSLATTTNRIGLHTTTIADFLRRQPGAYSHFVLLDHQDWLAANAPAALTEEWELILANARPGARILLRSAASRPETVPDFVRRRCRFRNDLSAPQARRDRVGTYAGTFLLEVINPAG
ncbi:MAG: BtaA family protein [Bacteroidota bacterium]